MTKAVGYIRVSKNPQADSDRASLPEQAEMVTKYCERKGYDLVKIFTDVAERWDHKRSGLGEMIAWGKTKPRPYDVILVCWADRLVGSTRVLAELEPLFDECGIDIEGIGEPISKQWLLINTLIAKGEIEAKRHRGKTGVRTAANRGHVIGPPRYGLKRGEMTGEVIVNEEEARWVRQIFEWCINGWGREKIAIVLNRLGVPTKRGGKRGWTPHMVARILHGTYTYGDAFYRVDDEELHIAVPPIISKDTFDLAAKAREGRKNFGNRPRNRTYLIKARKLRCKECSLGFRIISRNTKVRRTLKSGEVRTYQRKALQPSIICRGMDLHPHLFNCRSPKHLDFDKVQTMVVRRVAEIMSSEDFALAVACPDKGEVDRKEAKLREAKDKVKELEREISFVVTEGRTGKIPKRVYDEQIDHLNEVLEYWGSEVEQLEKQHHDAADKIAKIQRLEPLLSCWRGFWEAFKTAEVKSGPTDESDGMFDLPMTAKNLAELCRIIDYLVDCVTIDRNNNISIDLSLPVLDGIKQDADRSRQMLTAP
jgi:DNA invertase Pin-like site-specific DNA recombinase